MDVEGEDASGEGGGGRGAEEGGDDGSGVLEFSEKGGTKKRTRRSVTGNEGKNAYYKGKEGLPAVFTTDPSGGAKHFGDVVPIPILEECLVQKDHGHLLDRVRPDGPHSRRDVDKLVAELAPEGRAWSRGIWREREGEVGEVDKGVDVPLKVGDVGIGPGGAHSDDEGDEGDAVRGRDGGGGRRDVGVGLVGLEARCGGCGASGGGGAKVSHETFDDGLEASTVDL